MEHSTTPAGTQRAVGRPIRLDSVTNGAEARLRQGYRVVRQLAGEGDSPWPGALVGGPTGQTALAVDAEVLGTGWVGWDATPSGHVLAPVEILRRTDGHDVLLPVCTERLDAFLDRRARGGSDLTDGEGVTVVVSLLRGFAEVQALAAGVSGCWWLTEDGRPVFATDSGDRTIEEWTTELLRRVAVAVPNLEDAVAEAVDMMSDPHRRSRDAGRLEGVIFDVAEPLPLATTTFGPKRARDSAIADADIDAVDPAPARASWALSLSRHLDADWADLVSRTTTGLWRAVRTRRAARRGPWLVAGGLAGAIVLGGLLWPASAGGPATADAAPGANAAAPSPSPAPAPTAPVAGPSSPADETPDLVSIAVELLSARSACGAEPACLEDVVESSEKAYPTGVVDLPAEQRSLTLLDEFGGAAVLRAESVDSTGAPQLVVLVHADDRWLLRDVHDVAEQ